MKKIFLVTIAIVSFAPGFAQKAKVDNPGKIFFSSFIGIGTAKGELSTNATSGLQAMTGVEYKFNQHSSLLGELNFDGYSYKEVTATYSLNGSINIIPITILYKYTFGKNKWLPFIKAGAGVARVSVPIVTEKNGFTSINNNSSFAAQAQIAVGLNYAINKQYLIFTEAAYQQYSKINLLSNRTFGASAFRIGISTAL